MKRILRVPKFIHLSTHQYFTHKPKVFLKNYKLVISCGTLSALPIVSFLFQNEQDRRFIRVSISGIIRLFRCINVVTQAVADYHWCLTGIEEASDEYKTVITEFHQRTAERILKVCLENGGLFIKLGQSLVCMEHILPVQYTQTLKALQDRCLTRGKDEINQLLKEDMGKSPSDLFESFNEEPIAAASLAQVYRARTKNGEDVVVKVQYIDLQDRFIGDMFSLQLLLRVVGRFFSSFDFQFVLNEIKGSLESELDFLNEGRNAEKCAKDLAHLAFVYVPKIFWHLSSSRILTMEYVDGIKISNKETLLKENFSLADIDQKLFKTFAEQIFKTGFVHADPHAGNILVRKNKNKKAELVILDHGLYVTVPPETRKSLGNLWKSIVLCDHSNMKKYSVELGISESDYRLFCIALGQRYIEPEKKCENKFDDMYALLFSPGGLQNMRSKLKFLSQEEKDRIYKEIDAIHEQSLDVFKAMPSKLMLVTRNINTIRSIAKGHGNPVDRYKVMARSATEGVFVSENSNLKSRISAFRSKAHFEFQLWWSGFKTWALQFYLKSLSYFNLVPLPSSSSASSPNFFEHHF